MPLSFIREFKLGGPNGDGVHPYLNERGAFLGDGTALLEKDSIGMWRVRPRPHLEKSVAGSYGVPANLEWRMGRFEAVARALNKGNHSLAAIILVHAELPPLPLPPGAGRSAMSGSRFAKDAHDVSSEPRIPAGQTGGGEWTDGEGDSGSAASQDGNDKPVSSINPPTSAALATTTVAAADSGAEVAALLRGLGRSALTALTVLGEGLAAPLSLAALGLVLFPTSTGGVSEGTLPDNPDVKYRLDERELTIWQEDAQGNRTTLYSGLPDSDGLYRDADGDVLARNLGGSIAINGPGVVAMTDALQLPASSINERRSGIPTTVPDTPECEEEWTYAARQCDQLRRKGLLGTRGYPRNYERCLMGLVSEKCGGNPVDRD